MDKVAFGSDIKRMREEKGISLKQLGDKAGFSKSYISMIENGKLKSFPKPETLEKLAKGLNVDYHMLMLMAGYIDQKQFTRIKIYDFEEKEKRTTVYEEPTYNVDLYRYFRSGDNFNYNGRVLKDKDINDIMKFIENFILKDGE